MKFTSVLVATIASMVITLAHAADADANVNTDSGTTIPLVANANGPENDMPTPDQALKAVHELDLPAGVKLTDTTEPIQMTPTDKEGGHHEITTITNDKQEQFVAGLAGLGGLGGGLGLGIGGGLGGLGLGWGRLRWGGWSGWGGWGGLGPYRFGYSCGGLGGWAYPLGFWNAFGAGIWGRGCGLGIPYGGLFYC